MNSIKSKEINDTADETSDAYVSPKITINNPNIKTLSAKKQQQKSH